MNYRILGKDLKVSAVGLGCMGMSHAYGSPADKKEMCELIAKAVDLGYNFFDTAEVYGTANNPHDNEELVGKALKPYRDKIIIATKFGIEFDKTSNATNPPLIPNSRPEVIRKSVESSLKRLGTDHIDLYYQHRFDPNVPIEEVAGVMADLIKEGKITHWGMSEATEENIRKANSVYPLTAIQNRYSMMARHYESLFPVLEELNIGFVAFSPLANGFLSGKYNENSKFEKGTDYRTVMPQFTADGVHQNKDLLELLNTLAKDKNATPAQISLAWMMCKKPYIVPIPGTRKLDRLIENAGSADVILTSDEVCAIDDKLNNIEMSEVFGGSKIIKNKRRFLIMKKNFGAKPYLFPQPVMIIATYDENGKANAMNAAWGGIVGMNEIIVDLGSHKTTDNLLKTKAFTVSVADVEHLVACDYVGIVSANKEPDKMEKAGFTTTKSEFVNAPVINELPLVLECQLIKVIDDSKYLGEIKNVSIDEGVLGEDGELDLNKFIPITYDSVHHGYYRLGEKVGNAFSDGTKLK